MKFVSKNQNLRVVLKHGVPAEPITGRAAVSGLYVKFEQGIANVNDDEICRLMLSHPGFNSDFILIEENMSDPYDGKRKSSEPGHSITELEYGHIKNKTVSSPEKTQTQELIVEMAKKLAKEMLLELSSQVSLKQKENDEISCDEDPKVITLEKKIKTKRKTKKSKSKKTKKETVNSVETPKEELIETNKDTANEQFN